MDVLICTGDRDALQLVDRPGDGAVPARGISDMTRFTPEEVAGEVRPDARRSTPTSRPCAATRATTCPASRAWGRRPRPSGSASSARSTRCRPGRRGQGQGRRRAARAPRQRRAQPPAHRAASRDVPLAVGPHDLHPAQWDREEVHKLFDTLQFRVLRERLYQTLTAAAARGRGGLRGRRQPARRRRRARLAGRARARRRAGRRRVPRHLGARHRRRSTGLALAAADAAARLRRPDPAHRGRRTRAGRLAGRPGRTEGAARRQGPAARARAQHGWPLAGVTSDTALAAYLALPGQRSFDLADLALRYLRRELRAERADEIRAAVPRRLDWTSRTTSRRGRDSFGRARSSTSPTRSTPISSSRGARQLLRRPGASAHLRARRHGAHGHRRRRRPARRAGGAARRRGEARRAGGVRVRSAASSTSARPSSCRRSCSTSSSCPRRRGSRPATPPTPTRWLACTHRPSTRSSSHLLRHRDVARLKTRRRLAAADWSTTTVASTPRSTRRSRRPAGCPVDRPEPAEHPGPHRRGPADPRGVHRRRRLRVR